MARTHKRPLTTTARNHLSSKAFALPGRRYPIHDESHARNALARVSENGSPEEKAKVRAAVHKRFPGIGKSERHERKEDRHMRKAKTRKHSDEQRSPEEGRREPFARHKRHERKEEKHERSEDKRSACRTCGRKSHRTAEHHKHMRHERSEKHERKEHKHKRAGGFEKSAWNKEGFNPHATALMPISKRSTKKRGKSGQEMLKSAMRHH